MVNICMNPYFSSTEWSGTKHSTPDLVLPATTIVESVLLYLFYQEATISPEPLFLHY